MTLGERIAAVFSCPACKVPMDVEFLAEEVPVELRPQDTVFYTWHRDGADQPVRFRLPNGADQEAVATPTDTKQWTCFLIAA